MFIGVKDDGTEVRVDSKTLTTHAVVLGSTGSGKSGLLIGIAEELQEQDISVILVDIKGDMVNLALQEEHKKIRFISPGGGDGEAVNVLADLGSSDLASRKEAVISLLSMVGEDPTSSARVYLMELLDYMEAPTLRDLIVECAEPSIDYLGPTPLKIAFPTRKRNALTEKLTNLFMSDTYEGWAVGDGLNIEELVQGEHATVYSVAHLHNEYEQKFAISLLTKEIVKWMKKQKGSDELRLVLMVDECVGLIPPTANPITKEPLMKLLKQARAFGVGVVLGTQNPVDLDYKALSNCGTWFIGRMTANRDRAKVSSAMSSLGASEAFIKETISRLKPRHFLGYTSKALNLFKTRDTKSELRGPMTGEDISQLFDWGYLTLPPRKRKKVEKVIVKEAQKEEIPDSYGIKESFIALSVLGVYGYALTLLFEKVVQWTK